MGISLRPEDGAMLKIKSIVLLPDFVGASLKKPFFGTPCSPIRRWEGYLI